jgi:alginate O-acetyltransferase complex protein AlgI
VLLANNMAIVADRAFSAGSDELSVAFAWVGALAYTFQIFFDFSGYSEMAIGLGKMFGFEFLPNFNFPYISKSVSEFWRRWHISLGTWFRDYIYFPLGGSRVKSRARLVFNTFVVWLLTGIWHGANWTFILWGLMYFVLISFEKLTDFEHKKHGAKKAQSVCAEAARYVYTCFFVVLGWVLFRADSVSQAFHYMKVMFGFGSHTGLTNYLSHFYVMEYGVFFAACILASVPFADALKRKLPPSVEKLKYVIYAVLMAASVSYVVKGSYNPFIYFNF